VCSPQLLPTCGCKCSPPERPRALDFFFSSLPTRPLRKQRLPPFFPEHRLRTHLSHLICFFSPFYALWSPLKTPTRSPHVVLLFGTPFFFFFWLFWLILPRYSAHFTYPSPSPFFFSPADRSSRPGRALSSFTTPLSHFEANTRSCLISTPDPSPLVFQWYQDLDGPHALGDTAAFFPLSPRHRS